MQQCRTAVVTAFSYPSNAIQSSRPIILFIAPIHLSFPLNQPSNYSTFHSSPSTQSSSNRLIHKTLTSVQERSKPHYDQTSNPFSTSNRTKYQPPSKLTKVSKSNDQKKTRQRLKCLRKNCVNQISNGIKAYLSKWDSISPSDKWLSCLMEIRKKYETDRTAVDVKVETRTIKTKRTC